MVDTKEYMYSLKEIAVTLVKQNQIHEGYWAVALEFQLGATLAANSGGPPLPTGMVSVSRIGLRISDQVFPHAVNAAEVNPLVTSSEGRRAAPKVAKK